MRQNVKRNRLKERQDNVGYGQKSYQQAKLFPFSLIAFIGSLKTENEFLIKPELIGAVYAFT